MTHQRKNNKSKDEVDQMQRRATERSRLMLWSELSAALSFKQMEESPQGAIDITTLAMGLGKQASKLDAAGLEQRLALQFMVLEHYFYQLLRINLPSWIQP
jgi:hypothetical protein